MDSLDETSSKKEPKAKSKSQLQDDSIQGTNNSSIVSKRSVERIYFPNETHFFRYFVKKPQRRAPLINRGYWLRMKAIDQTVHSFLERPSSKKTVIVNLGCGYDPLPWQCLMRYPDICKNAVFVDIDYRDLMLKKRAIVQDVHQLNSMLTHIEESEDDILLRSDQYLQVGCDLRDLDRLSYILSDIIDNQKCRVLFTAEVSITYMSVESADALIKFCSTIPDACFCLLEQLLPGGLDHPFSQTMMAHFNKLQTPLHAVKKYPTTLAQQRRFADLGWGDINVHNLWELWSSSDFITAQERKDLDTIEPFDEWEEFALFACHYFLLKGSTTGAHPQEQSNLTEVIRLGKVMHQEEAPICLPELHIAFSVNPKSKGCKRFAATIPVRSQRGTKDRIGLFGGMGFTSRVNSSDEYHSTDQLNRTPYYFDGPSIAPSSRMCHTITDLGETGALLVGGRTSPDSGMVDCWLYHKWLNTWEQVDDLPWPLYRHQAIKIDTHHVLVSTGRINTFTTSNRFLVWSRRGWLKCSYGSDFIPPSSYGSVFIKYLSASDLQGTHGILAGGISSDGIVLQQTSSWVLTNLSTAEPVITFQSFENIPLFSRFGANVVTRGDKVFLIGGVIKDKLLSSADEICCFELRQNHESIVPVHLKLSPMIPRPMLIGTTTFSAEQSFIILGGSAVCFSFGTYWNQGIYIVSLNDLELMIRKPSSLTHNTYRAPIWEFSRTTYTKASNVDSKPPHSKLFDSLPTECGPEITGVPRVSFGSAVDFNQILRGSKPVIFENFDIGSCTSTWTPGYLKQRVGTHREVIVHEASREHMDFKAKNFTYTSKRFGELIDGIENGEKMYLRSLSSDQPTLSAASFARDFPSLAADFRVPPELSLASENAHSSPLRISGPVIMWLHYDVMANILCQIRGTKRLILYPPSDFRYFEFEPGSSSSSVNVFERINKPSLAGSHPQEAELKSGDILFIPPLWLHSASPISGASIAVNIFFRSLKGGYAAGKDVYGNRDLQAYEKGRQDIAKILRSFDNIPAEARRFYLERLAEELKQNAS